LLDHFVPENAQNEAKEAVDEEEEEGEDRHGLLRLLHRRSCRRPDHFAPFREKRKEDEHLVGHDEDHPQEKPNAQRRLKPPHDDGS